MKSHHKYDIAYINDVWYNRNPIKNNIIMKDMTEKFRVTIGSKEELAFLVYIPNKIVKSNQFSNGLYAIYPNDKKGFVLTKKEYQFMNTLEENLKCLSPIQKTEQRNIDNSTKRWEIPRWMISKVMIWMNITKENEVTTDDVDLDMKTYGTDIG